MEPEFDVVAEINVMCDRMVHLERSDKLKAATLRDGPWWTHKLEALGYTTQDDMKKGMDLLLLLAMSGRFDSDSKNAILWVADLMLAESGCADHN